jgi:diguanylate cyclase (GGDEF)-like protein
VSSILRVYRNFQGLLDYSERDTLTGLLNRKTFDGSFLRVASPAAESPHPVRPDDLRRAGALDTAWLGVIDIDHFKSVNDNHGHLIGDEVLLLVARLMRSSFRFQDQLYRFGGEEFVVLMRGVARVEQAHAAFERLRSNVESYIFPRVGRITVSVGFTQLRTGDSPSGAFERADKAVYHAKQNGRNQVAHHGDLIARGCSSRKRAPATWNCSENRAARPAAMTPCRRTAGGPAQNRGMLLSPCMSRTVRRTAPRRCP